MKIIFCAALCFCFHCSFSQKLNINSLESILHSSFYSADSLLKRSKFQLSDKESGEGYDNYYYTSYEKPDNAKPLLRSISLMDVYTDGDTSRLILYRTYYKEEQEEMKKQLIANGYEITKRTGNNFIYKKENIIISSNISEKQVAGGKTVTAYEFELGR